MHVVIIEVNGGVADYTIFGTVEVVLVDYDNLKESSNEVIQETILELESLPNRNEIRGMKLDIINDLKGYLQ